MGNSTLSKIFCIIGTVVGLGLTILACVTGGWKVLLSVVVAALAACLAVLLLNKTKRVRYGLIFALAITVLPRIAAIILFPVCTDPVHDFGNYYRLAECFAGGTELVKNSAQLFPHMFFFSFALSLPFRVFGASIAVYQICGILLSCVTVSVIYCAVKRIRGEKGAIFAALLFGLNPAAILYASLCCGEHLALCLLAIVFYLLVRFETKRPVHVWSAILWGVALGIVMLALELIRPVAIIPVIAMVLTWIAHKKRLKISRAGALLLALLVMLFAGREAALSIEENVIKKEVARNTTAFTLLVGANAASGGAWNEDDSTMFHDAAESGDYAALRRETVMRYKSLGILGTARLFAEKSAKTWGGQGTVFDYLMQYSKSDNPLLGGKLMYSMSSMCGGFSAMLMLFAAAAALRGFKKGISAVEMTALLGIIGFACMFALSEAAGRYSLIALPMLTLLLPSLFFEKISLDKR